MDGSVPAIFEILGEQESGGLWSAADAQKTPITKESPTPSGTRSTAPGTPPEADQQPGELLVRAVSKSIGNLEGQGHFGPFAVVLGQELFAAAETPSPGSLVLPQDRIIPFLGGGSFLRSSALDDWTGMVVALGGAPVDLVVATDISLNFLEVTSEPTFVFRVFEKIVLRIKQREAIRGLALDNPAPATPGRSSKK